MYKIYYYIDVHKIYIKCVYFNSSNYITWGGKLSVRVMCVSKKRETTN